MYIGICVLIWRDALVGRILSILHELTSKTGYLIDYIELVAGGQP